MAKLIDEFGAVSPVGHIGDVPDEWPACGAGYVAYRLGGHDGPVPEWRPSLPAG
ncbi:hypothetical protein ACF1E9_14960 [Streptomyces roseolus]|uniref:hypothetical protein n=1 Tax=Streptomyces roseolus TaxID=67358 RepID=UPI003700D62B